MQEKHNIPQSISGIYFGNEKHFHERMRVLYPARSHGRNEMIILIAFLTHRDNRVEQLHMVVVTSQSLDIILLHAHLSLGQDRPRGANADKVRPQPC